jgi:glyoxylase-like metal-dependent hydrolase (beta-lactamase superfamily II)
MLQPPNAPEVSADELADALDRGAPMQIVDVRAPFRLETGTVDLGRQEHFHNIVGSQLIQVPTIEGAGLDPTVPISVVCGRGNDSKVLASHLNRLGGNARSLKGGMAAWMRVLLPRDLAPSPSLDRLVQFDRVGKGAIAYLLVSEGAALAVDVPLDASAVRRVLEEHDLDLVGVADTHVHADYVSGAAALAHEHGVPYYLHPADNVYPYDGTPGRLAITALADGSALSVGRATVRAMHTPGHTEGSVTFLVDDAIALTGDFLFVRSIGRPDLGGKVEAWASALWHSVTRAKTEWSSDVVIYPAHYAGNDERREDRTIGVRFGDLVAENEALQFAGEEDFVAWVVRHTSSFPEAYRTIKAINAGLMALTELEVEQLEVGKNECALGGR